MTEANITLGRYMLRNRLLWIKRLKDPRAQKLVGGLGLGNGDPKTFTRCCCLGHLCIALQHLTAVLTLDVADDDVKFLGDQKQVQAGDGALVVRVPDGEAADIGLLVSTVQEAVGLHDISGGLFGRVSKGLTRRSKYLDYDQDDKKIVWSDSCTIDGDDAYDCLSALNDKTQATPQQIGEFLEQNLNNYCLWELLPDAVMNLLPELKKEVDSIEVFY